MCAIGRSLSNARRIPRWISSSGYFFGLGIGSGGSPSARTSSWLQGLRRTRDGSGLEVLLCVGWWGERAEGSGAALGRVAARQVVGAFEAEDLGVVDGLLELMALEQAGEVEEGAGG